MDTATETETKDYASLQFYANEQPQDDTAPGGEFMPKNEPPPQLGADELAFMLKLGFDLVAKRRGEHWAIDTAEAGALGEAADRVLAKYLPDLQTGPEVALMLTGAAILLPRFLADRSMREAEGKADADKP
jgi:hypothetical protein